MRFSKDIRIARAMVCALCCLMMGCNGNKVTVSGTVSVAGEPVSSGTIAFEPSDGKGREFGGLIADGRYSVGTAECMSPGTKHVRITVVQKTGRRVAVGSPAPPGTVTDELRTLTPPPQTVELVAGRDNEISFDIP